MFDNRILYSPSAVTIKTHFLLPCLERKRVWSWLSRCCIESNKGVIPVIRHHNYRISLLGVNVVTAERCLLSRSVCAVSPDLVLRSKMGFMI